MDKTRISKLAITIGAALLALSIVFFIITAVFVGEMSTYTGYSMSSAEALNAVKSMSSINQLAGVSITESMGISDVALSLAKIAVPLRIPLLIFGIIGISGGFILKRMRPDAPVMKKVCGTIFNGAKKTAGFIKNTIEKESVLCPACGKSCAAKAVFCDGCGKKLPEPIGPAAAAAKKTCIYCGTELNSAAKFCSICGNSIQPELAAATPSIAAEYSTPPPPPAPVYKAARAEKPLTPDYTPAKSVPIYSTMPVARPAEHDAPTPSAAPTEAAPPAQNPFMNKPQEL